MDPSGESVSLGKNLKNLKLQLQIQTLIFFTVFKKINIRYFKPFRLTADPFRRWHTICNTLHTKESLVDGGWPQR